MKCQEWSTKQPQSEALRGKLKFKNAHDTAAMFTLNGFKPQVTFSLFFSSDDLVTRFCGTKAFEPCNKDDNKHCHCCDQDMCNASHKMTLKVVNIVTIFTCVVATFLPSSL